MDQHRVPGFGWLIVAMLLCFMLINFADKAVLGLSAVPIMRELQLDHTEFGLIGTSFFLFFSISAVVVGFLANRWSTKWLLFAMALSWALVQLPLAFVSGLPILVANRVLLGIGEGPAYPVTLHSMYKWFPNKRRPLPTSLVGIGGAIGAGLVAPAIVYMIVQYSWQIAFVALGAVGLCWCAAWLCIGREGPLTTEAVSTGATIEARIPYARLLTSRTFVGQALVAFAAYWLIALGLVWLPAYLTRDAGYTPAQTGWIVAMPAVMQIVLFPSVGALSEWLQRRGVSSRLARGGLSCLGLLVAGLFAFALPQVSGMMLPIICTALAFASGPIVFILGHVMVAEISPMRQRGAMLAIGNAFATLAGPLAPVVMGMIVDNGVDEVSGFRTGFMLTGGTVAVIAVLATLLIDPEGDRVRLATVYAASRQLDAKSVAET